MIDINKKLRTHIILEFCKKTILNEKKILNENKILVLEKHGIMSNLEHYWLIFQKALKNTKPNKNGDFVINSNIFYDIPNNPFYGVYIKVHFIPSEIDRYWKGAYHPTEQKNEEGKIFLKMTFEVSCRFEDITKKIKSIFIHEITHAYEDYMRMSQGKPGMRSFIDNTNYHNLQGFFNNYGTDVIKSDIDQICYLLSSFEANAYVPTLITDVENQLYTAKNTKEIYDIIRNTFIWQKIKECVETINNYIDKDFPPHLQEKILKAWEEVTGEKYDNYNTLRKILKYKYLKKANKMVNQICKAAFDVYNRKQKIFYDIDEKNRKYRIQKKLNQRRTN
jgi:hypothetical protein